MDKETWGCCQLLPPNPLGTCGGVGEDRGEEGGLGDYVGKFMVYKLWKGTDITWYEVEIPPMRYLIVETDNYGGDYPGESFLPVGSFGSKKAAQTICDLINAEGGSNALRYYKVVEVGYTLQPGFEP